MHFLQVPDVEGWLLFVPRLAQFKRAMTGTSGIYCGKSASDDDQAYSFGSTSSEIVTGDGGLVVSEVKNNSYLFDVTLPNSLQVKNI